MANCEVVFGTRGLMFRAWSWFFNEMESAFMGVGTGRRHWEVHCNDITLTEEEASWFQMVSERSSTSFGILKRQMNWKTKFNWKEIWKIDSTIQKVSALSFKSRKLSKLMITWNPIVAILQSPRSLGSSCLLMRTCDCVMHLDEITF